MALRALDLMIGDWVKVTDDDTDDSFIGQIKAIDGLENINVQEGEDVAYPYSIDCLEPIPLTPEILEKNGWRSRMNGTGEFYLKKPLVDAAIVTKNIIGFQMNHGPFCGLSIHYVNELQHALRLCGIEKEIEL